MPSHRAVLGAALLAGLAGAVASLYFQPRLAIQLANTEWGQRTLGTLLAARAPAPPPGLAIARPGARLPSFTVHTLDGTPVALPGRWAGRTTVVNLWATWCAPCLREMPILQAFARTQAQHGTQLAGIAMDDAAAVRNFLHAHPARYPQLVAAPGPADAGVRLGNPAGVLPYTVLVDADGRLLKTHIGPFADTAALAAWAAP